MNVLAVWIGDIHWVLQRKCRGNRTSKIILHNVQFDEVACITLTFRVRCTVKYCGFVDEVSSIGITAYMKSFASFKSATTCIDSSNKSTEQKCVHANKTYQTHPQRSCDIRSTTFAAYQTILGCSRTLLRE
jgi:hypothetical protein